MRCYTWVRGLIIHSYTLDQSTHPPTHLPTCPISTKKRKRRVANRCPLLSKKIPPRKGMKKLGREVMERRRP